VYLCHLCETLALPQNAISFQSTLQPMWEYASSTPKTETAVSSIPNNHRKTLQPTTTPTTTTMGSWKLEDLQTLQDVYHIPVLFVQGRGDGWGDDLFTTPAQRQVITKGIGARHYLQDLGQGHLPWWSHPVEMAQALEDFWKEPK